jgi:hypothetical protein
MKRSPYLHSQITGGVENAVPLHVDVPRTGGRVSDLFFEAVLQEFFSSTNILFSFLFRSGVTVVNFVLQTTPEDKITRIKIR